MKSPKKGTPEYVAFNRGLLAAMTYQARMPPYAYIANIADGGTAAKRQRALGQCWFNGYDSFREMPK